jgi:hypothetical protein
MRQIYTNQVEKGTNRNGPGFLNNVRDQDETPHYLVTPVDELPNNSELKSIGLYSRALEFDAPE